MIISPLLVVADMQQAFYIDLIQPGLERGYEAWDPFKFALGPDSLFAKYNSNVVLFQSPL